MPATKFLSEFLALIGCIKNKIFLVNLDFKVSSNQLCEPFVTVFYYKSDACVAQNGEF